MKLLELSFSLKSKDQSFNTYFTLLFSGLNRMRWMCIIDIILMIYKDEIHVENIYKNIFKPYI